MAITIATVVVDLTTHDADGITQKDLDLARAMDELAARMRGGHV